MALHDPRDGGPQYPKRINGLPPSGGFMLVVEQIKRAVCLEFGLCRAEIESHQRRRSVAGARMVAMSLAKRMTDLSLTRVGHMFGNHSRWAVNYACKRVDPYVVIVAQTLPAKAAPQDWVKALQAMMELSR